MELIAQVLIRLIVVEHVYILWMEMFAWETAGKKTFKDALPEDLFKSTKGLAANQGLYNGFFAAGFCAVVAGTYGSLSANKKIFFVQALPAMVAFLFLLIS